MRIYFVFSYLPSCATHFYLSFYPTLAAEGKAFNKMRFTLCELRVLNFKLQHREDRSPSKEIFDYELKRVFPRPTVSSMSSDTLLRNQPRHTAGARSLNCATPRRAIRGSGEI